MGTLAFMIGPLELIILVVMALGVLLAAAAVIVVVVVLVRRRPGSGQAPQAGPTPSDPTPPGASP